jgi:uncharacterized protein
MTRAERSHAGRMTIAPTTSAPPVREDLFTDAGLLGGHCASCAALQFPRREVCPQCQHDAVESVTLAGEGEVFTYTVVRSAPPGYLGEVPYAYGVVTLDDALRVTTTITSDDLDALAIGDRVAFEVITLGDGEAAVTSYAYRVAGEEHPS